LALGERRSQALAPAARSFAVTARSSVCRDETDIDAAMKLARGERGGVLVMPEFHDGTPRRHRLRRGAASGAGGLPR